MATNVDKLSYNIDDATVDQTDAIVIQQRAGKRIDINSANATGSNAADLKWYPATQNGKTKVSAAALINAVLISLDADDTGTKVGGVVVTTSDFVIVQLDTGGYQLFDILSVAADAGNDEIDIGVTAFGGGTGLDAAVAADNVAYIVFAADVGLVDVGNASISLEDAFSGRRGHPFGITIGESGGGTTHRVNGQAQYVA